MAAQWGRRTANLVSQPQLLKSPAANNKSRSGTACRINGQVGDGDPDEMDERQSKADCDGGETDRRLAMGRAHDDK
jgi:hypothetical protein